MQKKILAISASLIVIFPSLSSALDLEAAIANAEKIDPIVQSALANSEANLAGIQIAKSKLLPVVQGVGSYGRMNQTANRVDPVLGTTTQNFINSTPNSQIFLRQALFRMADWAGLNVSQMQTEFGLFKLAGAYSDLWLRVSNAWFDLISAQETVDIQVESEKSMRLISEQANKAFNAGVGTKDSALEAKAQLAFVRSNAIEAKLILASRQRAFEALTGVGLDTIQKTHLKFSKKYRTLAGGSKNFIDKVNTSAPDILAAKAAQQIRQMQLKQARFGSYPTVDLFASYQQTQNQNINQIGLGVISSQATVQLTIPFYSGGLYVGQERQAAAFLEAASADIRAAELKLNTGVITFWATQEAQLERVAAVDEMVSAGKEVVKAYRMSVNAGSKSWSDVGNAEVVLTRRQVDQVNAIASLLKAQAQLLSYLPVTDEVWQLWLNSLRYEVKKSTTKS